MRARVRTSAPTQKVMAGTIAGALTVILVWAAEEVWHLEIPPEVASALTVVLTFATSWWTPPAPDEVVVERE